MSYFLLLVLNNKNAFKKTRTLHQIQRGTKKINVSEISVVNPDLVTGMHVLHHAFMAGGVVAMVGGGEGPV